MAPSAYNRRTNTMAQKKKAYKGKNAAPPFGKKTTPMRGGKKGAC